MVSSFYCPFSLALSYSVACVITHTRPSTKEGWRNCRMGVFFLWGCLGMLVCLGCTHLQDPRHILVGTRHRWHFGRGIFFIAETKNRINLWLYRPVSSSFCCPFSSGLSYSVACLITQTNDTTKFLRWIKVGGCQPISARSGNQFVPLGQERPTGCDGMYQQ